MGKGLDDVELNVIESLDDVADFKSWLGERRDVMAVDTETGGLEAWREPLRMIQFGDTQNGWAIPFQLWGGVAIEALNDYDGDLVFHNAKFDITFIETHTSVRFDPGKIHDTRVMAHILNPTMSTALKNLTSRLVDRKAAALQDNLDIAMKSRDWTWRTIPPLFDLYWQYAALDPVLTAKLYEIMKGEIQSTYRDVYELEMGVSHILMNMERRGCRIDLEYTRDRGNELWHLTSELEEYCVQTFGISPGKNQGVIKRLQEDGIELSKLTPGGKLSLDAEVLESIDHPLAIAVLNRRKAEKILSTYFDNFEVMHDDGFLHPSINALGARTGRMSMSTPALQTLPRGRVVRDCFIPRTADHVLVSADFDQVEMRLLAHFTGEQAMIDAINSGDLHTETARRIYGDDTIGKTDLRRQLAKNAGFAKVYGAGAAKFSLTAGVPEDVGRQFLDAYDATYPGVRAFQNHVQSLAIERLEKDGVAWVRSPVGRRHIADKSKEYTLVNYLIQGTASDVLKQKLIEMDAAGLGDFMILPVHDEVIFDVPNDQINDVVPLIQQTMSDRDGWKVPLTVGTDVLPERWGDKYRYEGEFIPPPKRPSEGRVIQERKR